MALKKLAVVSALSIATALLGSFSYLRWASMTFASRELRNRTGAEKIQVLDEDHGANYWYVKALIDEKTGARLAMRYDWDRGFRRDRIAATLLSDYRMPDCRGCLYRTETTTHDRKYHPYNGTVYVLSPDLKVLEVYEQFGS